MRHVSALLAAVLASALPAAAQQSASYKLQESVLNAGGHPAGGTTLASASFRVKLDAIGEAVAGTGLASASYHGDGSFVSAYPPPGEARNLVFADKQTLQWSPENSVGHYEVYRDLLGTLPGGYGACFASGLTANTASDLSTPASGVANFYLVTVRNRLDEEGTKGFRSNGTQRPNPAPCP
jgi:hypothetical protein